MTAARPDDLPGGPAPAEEPPPARSTLDRAGHRRADQRWLIEAWARGRVLVVDVAGGGRALVSSAGARPGLVLLDAEVAAQSDPAGRLFLGVDRDGTPVFAVDAPLPVLPETRPASLREIGHLLDNWDAELFNTAVALANWHARHAYSSINGLPTSVGQGGWARIDEGGQQFWPRTDPAMIVLLHDGGAGPAGRCLLGSNAAWRADQGVRRFSCLAGYVEPGESAEATVLREVDEEVGLAATDLEYVGSQAWPFPGSLMLGFLALADPEQPIRLDPTEIAHARWFSRLEIGAVLAGESIEAGDGVRAGLPPPASIAHALIRRWYDGVGRGLTVTG